MVINTAQGLNQKQYDSNVQTYGVNVVSEVKPPSRLSIFLSQFNNPFIYILLLAAFLTIFVDFLAHGEVTEVMEFIGIMLVVLVNATLGFLQENRAEQALQGLTSTITPMTIVYRDGERKRVKVSNITVGDIVELKLGDKIPADGILFSGTDFSTNEAILTGESEPIEKSEFDLTSQVGLEDLRNLEPEYQLYMGTSVMSGIGRMLVTKVGRETTFGKIADSISSNEAPPTPLQHRLQNLTQKLTLMILGVSIFIVIIGLFQRLELYRILELAITVAVSAIPEGLVIALTVILALGMSRILKRKALVRKLVAAETLGSVDTICIDKTGTLTLGQMQVVKTFFSDQTLAKRALLATNHQVNGVEAATLEWLNSTVSAREKLEFGNEKYLEEKIFDSKTKFSATQGSENTYFVGAPEILLSKSTLSAKQKDHWRNEIVELSTQGMRLVAVAYQPSKGASFSSKQIPTRIRWLGLVVIEDPVRPNLAKVFKQANSAGITIKVITGDFGETARAVLAKIDIHLQSNEMVSGEELAEMDSEHLLAKIDKIKLFYRTTPDQKLRIIDALQSQGKVVAMMGDGINDTPALNKAEIGIVVENATDFSKEIADMVLLDSNFKTIIAAVEEGRGIFENMRKVLAYLLSDAFDALIIVVGGLLLGIPVPILPLQILYINFVADGLPDLALSFEKPEHEVMKQPPRPKSYPLLDREVRTMVLIIGGVVSTAILLLYTTLLNQGVGLDYARTLVMMTVGINSLIYIFPIRSFRKSLVHINPFSNKLLVYGVVFGIISMLLAAYFPPLMRILETVPIVASDWIIIVGIALIDLLIVELIKYRFMVKK